MKRNMVFIVVVVALVIASFVGFIRYFKAQAEMTELIGCMAELTAKVDNFHTEIRKLSPSLLTKDALEGQVSAMKKLAESNKDSLDIINAKTYALTGTKSVAVKEVTEATQGYFSKYASYANLEVDQKTLEASASDMLGAIDKAKQVMEVIGSPKKSDTTEAVGRAVKLVANYQKACNRKVQKAAVGSLDEYDRWGNADYEQYRQTMASIAADYNAGRRNLSPVIVHYDRGYYTASDQNVLLSEISRRESLMSRLQEIWRDIPVGSVYEEHHIAMRDMIDRALPAMRSFASNPCYATREEMRRISAVNNDVMIRKIKPFYGLR